MQEEIAKSDLIIAELNITIEDLREYNTKLENDIKIQEDDSNFNILREPLDFEQSDEWLNLEIEVARLQKEVTDRDTVIRTQKDALDKTLSKGSCASPRQISLAGAVKQALDVNVTEMARLYNETLRLCRSISTDSQAGTDNLMNDADREFYERKLDELDRKHYELIEELGLRHTEEMQTMRSDYEVLLELAVKEKEDEMRNTIIENGELEDMAEQVELLSGELKQKQKEIAVQRDSISYLEEELKQMDKKRIMSPIAPPQIIIEDPDGHQQCDQCEQKDQKLHGLEEIMNEMEENSGSEVSELRRQNDKLLDTTTKLEERLKVLLNAEEEGSQVLVMKQRIEHLKLEKEESSGLAKAEIKNFYNSLYERFNSIDKTFCGLRNCKSGVKNDLHRLRCEMEQFSTEVINVLNNFQTLCQEQQRQSVSISCVNISVQTDIPHTDIILSVNNNHASTTISNHSESDEFREKEGKYVKEIFELKVKLKELEAKVSHLNKKVKAAKSIPRTEFIVEGPNKEEKLMEMLQDKEEELRQARRLHGQNLATMRRRHDKVVSGLQANVDRLEMTVHQFIPRDADSKKRSRSMVLPQPPNQFGDIVHILE